MSRTVVLAGLVVAGALAVRVPLVATQATSSAVQPPPASVATQGGSSANQTAASVLEVPAVGRVLERPLGRGETHDWQMTLGAGELVELALEPVGIIIGDASEWPAVTVTDPDDVIVFSSDGPMVTLSIDAGTRTVVSFVARRAGWYRLRVTARRQSAEQLPYRLYATRRAIATDVDQARLALHQLWREALRLYAGGSRDLRQAARRKLEDALRFIDSASLGDEERALTLMTMAAVDYRLSDAAAGQAAARQALTLWQRLGRAREEGFALSDLGVLAYLAYEHQEARAFYDRALARIREVGDAEAEAVTLVRLGWVEFAAGEMARAIEANLQAVPLWKAAGSSGGMSVSLNDLGRAYAELGDVSLALDAYRDSLKTRPADIDARGAAVVLLRIGQLHMSVADWQPAFDAFQQALPLARRANDLRNEASVMTNLGSAYSRVGDSEQALRALDAALPLAQKSGNRTAEGNVLAALGVEAYFNGDLGRSRTYLQQALALQTTIGDVRGQAATLRYLASTQLAASQPREALDSITTSLERSQAAGVSASGLATLAAARAALGETAAADADYRRAIERARHIRARDQEASVLTLYGRFLAGHGRLSDARAQLDEAVSIHESLRAGLSDVDQRIGYTSRTTAPYESYIDVLLALAGNQPDDTLAREAFRTAERARGRGLLDLLAVSSVDVREGVDRELVNRERTLRWQLNAKAAVQTSLLTSGAEGRRVTRLEQEIAELTRAWRDTAAVIRQQSPSYASLTQPQPLAADEVQRLLDPQTVLLEFAMGESRSWLFALTDRTFDRVALPPRRRIDELAREVHRLLTARQPVARESAAARQSRIATADRDLAVRARELSDLVLGPLADKLAGEWRGRRLAIVATGALEYVPMAALPAPGAAGGGPLIGRHEIVMLPSASSLPFLRRDSQRRVARRTLAVVGDPVFASDDPRVAPVGQTAAPGLGSTGSPAVARAVPNANGTRGAAEAIAETSSPPGPLPHDAWADADGTRASLSRLPFSRVEAQAVAAQAPAAQVLQATDFEASLELATSGRLSDYRIVHLATHGLIDTTRPELSGLALSLVDRNGRRRDGFLRLNTIYNLRLSADLVVLSACQTALGKEVAGEGLVGLTRGFMQAGARRVIASLWQVNDAATAELMKRFYAAHLQQRLSAAAALRRAQREMAADPRWSAPYYWAGFVLQGDWSR